MSGSGATDDPLTFTNQNPKVAVRNTFGRFFLGQKYLCCKIACISNSEKIYNFNQHFIIIHLIIHSVIHSVIQLHFFNILETVYGLQQRTVHLWRCQWMKTIKVKLKHQWMSKKWLLTFKFFKNCFRFFELRVERNISSIPSCTQSQKSLPNLSRIFNIRQCQTCRDK